MTTTTTTATRTKCPRRTMSRTIHRHQRVRARTQRHSVPTKSSTAKTAKGHMPCAGHGLCRYQCLISICTRALKETCWIGRETQLPRGGNRYRRVQPEHIDWLKACIDTHPDQTIPSLQQELNTHFQLDPPISCSAVHRAVTKEAGYTLKMLRREPDSYNDPDHIASRQVWAKDIFNRHRSMDHFIYLDESGFSLHIHRQFGRAPRGIHPFRSVPTQKGTNMSLLVAVDRNGLVASETRIGSYNANRFAEYLRTKLFPQIQGQRRVLLLDNARIHKTAEVREAVDEASHTLLFLPPYSPHLNAAESLFSCVKTHVKKQDVQRDTLSGHILNGLNQVSREKAAGWIREVGLNFLLSLSGRPLGRLYNNHQVLAQIDVEDPYEEESDMEVNEGGEEDSEVDEEEMNNDNEMEGMADHFEQVLWEYDSDDDERLPAPAPAPIISRYSPRHTRAGTVIDH